MLLRVPQGSAAERSQALREVMQEIALAGLVRRGFFGKSAFFGGTCLRIFNQLPRLSEDLDFSLLRPDPEFSLQPYLQGLGEEFAGLGWGLMWRSARRRKQSTPPLFRPS
ncbi:TPA: nucleotidyl transferase AbiEii/AbiGii toxin family protein [Synechococcus sp. WH 5701]|uniref:nucleotidyl transferase AbiEii/AbiGii toxin family protein n=2 Tax=Synechococcus TaxID=1129 RepID=UPI003C3148FE